VQPWTRLTPDLAEILRPVLPALVDATVETIGREVPAYAGALRADAGPVVRRGTQIALTRLLDLFGTDSPALEPRAVTFYRRLGAGESEQGRSLEALLSAYRIGARVAWERMAAAAVAAAVPTADLVTLAEAIFAYIDELSGASAQGHANRAGQRGVLRSRLVEALLEGQAASDPVGLRVAADAAGWAVPERMAVAVVPLGGGREPTPPPDVLALIGEDEALAVVPDPSGPGRRRALTRAWAGSQVFVGTVRPPSEAPQSLAHARAVQRLVERGRVPSTRVVVAGDHLAELVIAADTELLEELRARVLAPLTAVNASKREMLEQTLAAWLALRGDRQGVAGVLHVHPQTVSYRVGRLRELFGPALDDPRECLALQMVLGVPDQSSGGGSA
jgi:hypothetical protein